MNTTFRLRWCYALLLLALTLPACADNVSPGAQTVTPSTLTAPAGIELPPSRRASNSFDAETWRLEHQRIMEARADRHQPTERGPWYSYQSEQEKVGHTISYGLAPLLATEGAYMALSGRDGRTAALDGVGALAVTGALTMTIKKAFPRRRPYPNDDQIGSFPSGHTSTAFAMAGVLGAADPTLRIPALLGAGAVGWARVKVRAHHWRDVVAGAALGLTVSNQFKPDKPMRKPLADLGFNF